MKIAYLKLAQNNGNLPLNIISDYMCDLTYIGLVNILGHENIYTSQYPFWLYENGISKEDSIKLYGKGFTYSRVLNEDEQSINYINDDILQNHKVDCILLLLHHTYCNMNYENNLLQIISNLINNYNYSPQQIIIIDGYDKSDYFESIINAKVHYFKRELCDNKFDNVHPISFAIPAKKICRNHDTPIKYDISPLIPVNQSVDPAYMSTYTYGDEVSYYKMYQSSIFGLTSSKAGFDCLRHYELIGNGCIPIFVDIEKCPQQTLFNFPKKLCEEVKKLQCLHLNLKNGQTWSPGMILDNCASIQMDNPGYIRRDIVGQEINKINELRTKLVDWISEYGHTEALAKYIINHVNR